MDSKLLRLLYLKYHRELFLYIYSLCRNRELAQDIVQETFLKAILSLPDNHTNVRAWLYIVARNLYLNIVRKERDKVHIDELRDMPANETDVTEQIVLRDRSRLLYKALENLDGVKREVLILQYFGGLSQKEIAAILHLTPENVRVLSFRGKRELKKYMEASGYDI